MAGAAAGGGGGGAAAAAGAAGAGAGRSGLLGSARAGGGGGGGCCGEAARLGRGDEVRDALVAGLTGRGRGEAVRAACRELASPGGRPTLLGDVPAGFRPGRVFFL